MLKDKAREINKQIAELRQGLIDFINDLPDSPDIAMIGPNCGVVSLSTVARNNGILSPAYYMSAEIKEVLTKAVGNTPAQNLDTLIENLIEKESYRYGGRTQPIHPDIVKRIKEMWYGHGKD